MTNSGARPRSDAGTTDALHGFLTERLTEELAALWDRDRALHPRHDRHPDGDGEHPGTRTGPGLAAQLGVLDDLLLTLQSGRLPQAFEVRLLLHTYSRHRDYDPGWTTRCVASQR
ncbi:MAG: hypothetical protein HY830_08620 [Actinobacteria bacterium]|nr:hypothetical protein [Actinomycetota bacterium]